MADPADRCSLIQAPWADQEAFVLGAVRADPIAAVILERADHLGAPKWALAAGAVYQNVWNALTGRPAGHGVRDYDLAYCDTSDLSWTGEDAVIARAADLFADVQKPVEARNQARVHLWFEDKYGEPRQPITSIESALLGYAAPAHMVAVRRGAHGVLEVVAPRGLEDVFAMVIRPDRPAAYTADLMDKAARMQAIWPELRLETGL